MKKKVARQWVAAIRSGQYRQGTGRLRTGNKFCCLGVLCNLHAKAHPDIAATQTDKREYLGRDKILPLEVTVWAGMCSNYGTLGNVSLANLNDDGYSFDDIADLIEKRYRLL